MTCMFGITSSAEECTSCGNLLQGDKGPHLREGVYGAQGSGERFRGPAASQDAPARAGARIEPGAASAVMRPHAQHRRPAIAYTPRT